MAILREEKYETHTIVEYHMNWQWLQDSSGNRSSWHSSICTRGLQHSHCPVALQADIFFSFYYLLSLSIYCVCLFITSHFLVTNRLFFFLQVQLTITLCLHNSSFLIMTHPLLHISYVPLLHSTNCLVLGLFQYLVLKRVSYWSYSSFMIKPWHHSLGSQILVWPTWNQHQFHVVQSDTCCLWWGTIAGAKSKVVPFNKQINNNKRKSSISCHLEPVVAGVGIGLAFWQNG